VPASADTRRYLPLALIATGAVVVLPAIVVLPLAPLEGALDLVVSAVFAIGLSVMAGSIGSALWSRRPESREIVFGDLMLWRLIRRMVAERRLARAATKLNGDVCAADGLPPDPLLPALQRLAGELEARDSYSRGHSERTARHAERIARELSLDDAEVEKIRAAASLHDIGMLFVPHSIVTQSGRLTDDERTLIERHAEQGAEVVSELDDPEITAMVRHHHERVDGAGYPDGLAGAEIPLGARIIAVAATFDAMTSERPFRGAMSQRSALDSISEAAGSQLDPEIVSAFLDYYSGKRAIAGVALVASAPQRLVSWIAATPAGVGASAAPITQGVCAAGAVAIAGVCIGGAPNLGSSPSHGDASKRQAAQVAGQPSTTATAVADSSTSGADERSQRRKDGERGGDGDRRQAPGAGSPDADTPAADQPGAQVPGSNGGGGGDGPSPSNPSSGGGGESPVAVPESPTETPQVIPPALQETTQGVLDPVVETVDQVLAPLPEPVKGLTGPVKDLLSGTGLTSPR
jgi:HD-GYP domain-containing protein (c-di-GMP phosphodiesterase class II)